MIRGYSYSMGFAVNGVPIPDPSAFSGAVSDLDASGERDASGELHRDRVATKIPIKLKYNNWDWEMIKDLLIRVSADAFEFTFPNPVTGQLATDKRYVGDRDFELVLKTQHGYIGNLSFSTIPY
jgi:hypothetical protein